MAITFRQTTDPRGTNKGSKLTGSEYDNTVISLLNNGYVSVKDFGAVGDGVNDDTQYIQDAINYCEANSKSLYFEEGVYLIDGGNASDNFNSLLSISSSISIVGANPFTTTIKYFEQDKRNSMFLAQDVSGITFSNIGFDGNQSGYGVSFNHCLKFYGCSNVTVRGCYFTRFTIGVRFSASNQQVGDLCWVDSNQFFENGASVTSKAGGANRMFVTNNYCNTISAGCIVIDAEQSYLDNDTGILESCVISGNIIKNVDSSLDDGNAVGITVQEGYKNVIVSDNVIDGVKPSIGNNAQGINITTSPTQTDKLIESIIVESNVITGVENTAGIQLLSGDEKVESVLVSNNIIYDCLCNSGIVLDGDTEGNIDKVIISGNIINNLSSSNAQGILYDNAGSAKSVIIGENIFKEIDGNSMRVRGDYVVVTSNLSEDCDRLINCQGDNCLISSNISVLSKSNGILLNGCSFTHVTSNSVFNTSGVGIMGISAPDNIVTSNTVTDNQASKTQTYGIQTDASSGSWRVSNNYLRGNLTGAINDLSGTINAGNITSIDTSGNVLA